MTDLNQIFKVNWQVKSIFIDNLPVIFKITEIKYKNLEIKYKKISYIKHLK